MNLLGLKNIGSLGTKSSKCLGRFRQLTRKQPETLANMIWFFGTCLEGDRIMCRDSRGETLDGPGHDSTLLNQIHALGHLFQSNLKRHCMIESTGFAPQM